MKAFILTLLLGITLSACTKARSDDIEIRFHTAPDGVSCYVLMQNGEARGLWCRQ